MGEAIDSLFGGLVFLMVVLFSVIAYSVCRVPEPAYHKAVQQAIDAGVASWVVDPKTGQTTLKYGCPCQEESNE